MFTVELPVCPSANMAFAHYRGRRISTREHRAWKAKCAPMVLDAWEAQDRPQIGKPYAIHIAVNVNHQSDIANREKLATDLLVKTIPGFPGDQWINQVVIERDTTVEGMKIDVHTMPAKVLA